MEIAYQSVSKEYAGFFYSPVGNVLSLRVSLLSLSLSLSRALLFLYSRSNRHRIIHFAGDLLSLVERMARARVRCHTRRPRRKNRTDELFMDWSRWDSDFSSVWRLFIDQFGGKSDENLEKGGLYIIE